MQDQKELWNKTIASEGVFQSTTTQTDFAEEVLSSIQPRSKILDVGCGLGTDAAIFAQAGHTVLATDFSKVAIEKNREKFKTVPHLSFELLDLHNPFRFNANEFDVVYARLSLHYFTDAVTRNIFNEIHRVLKPTGYLCFLCKSTSDKLYGEGTEIEKDMFERKGHVRHFFSEEYTRSLLAKHFEIDILELGDKRIYTRDASFIKVIAHAIKQ